MRQARVLVIGLLVAVVLAVTLHAQNYIWSSINGVPVAPRVLAGSGTVSAPSYGFSTEPNTGLYLYGTNVPAIAVNGVLQTAWYYNKFYLKSDTHQLSWGVNDDVAIVRLAAGFLQVTNGAGVGASIISWLPTYANTAANLTIDSSTPGYVVHNTGDSDGSSANLPANPASGFTITFYVTAAQTMTITAQGGSVIRLGSGLTAANGSISSNVPGSSVTLVALNPNWYATSVVGSWSY